MPNKKIVILAALLLLLTSGVLNSYISAVIDSNNADKLAEKYGLDRPESSQAQNEQSLWNQADFGLSNPYVFAIDFAGFAFSPLSFIGRHLIWTLIPEY